MKLIEIEWIDSAFNRGWGSSKEKRDSMSIAHCRSVGYLVAQDEESVKIAQSHDVKDDTLADGISIPRVAVKRMRTLKGGF